MPGIFVSVVSLVHFPHKIDRDGEGTVGRGVSLTLMQVLNSSPLVLVPYFVPHLL